MSRLRSLKWGKLALRLALVGTGGACAALANYAASSKVAGTSTVVVVLVLRELDKLLEARAKAQS